MFHTIHEGAHALSCAICGYTSGSLSRETAERGHGATDCPQCRRWCNRVLRTIRQAEEAQSGAYFALRTYLVATAGPRILSWKPGVDVWTELLGRLEHCRGVGPWRIRLENWCDENPQLARMIPGLLQESA